MKEVRKRRAHQGEDFNRRHYTRNGEIVSVHRPHANMKKDGLERPAKKVNTITNSVCLCVRLCPTCLFSLTYKIKVLIQSLVVD